MSEKERVTWIQDTEYNIFKKKSLLVKITFTCTYYMYTNSKYMLYERFHGNEEISQYHFSLKAHIMI